MAVSTGLRSQRLILISIDFGARFLIGVSGVCQPYNTGGRQKLQGARPFLPSVRYLPGTFSHTFLRTVSSPPFPPRTVKIRRPFSSATDCA
jgi:hypothetical protein